MNSVYQSLKSEILKLLFASTWQSQEVTITYQNFVTLVRNFAQRFHTERPVLTALLNDIDEVLQPIIDQLVEEEQFIIRTNSRNEIITIEYRGYYLTATNHWYKRLEKDLESPFPNNQLLKFNMAPDLYISLTIEELHNRYMDLIGYEKLIILQFSNNISEVAITAELLRDRILELCLRKIEKYISQRQLIGEIGEKMDLSPEELLSTNNLLVSISEAPAQEIQRIESGNKHAFQLWTTINKILQEEFQENSGINATYESYYQAICILHQIVLIHHSARLDTEVIMQKEEYILEILSREPYVYLLKQIKGAYIKTLAEHSLTVAKDSEAEELLQLFINKNTSNAYPGVTCFDGLDGNMYYALTPRLVDVYVQQIQTMRTNFKQYYHTCYSSWIAKQASYPFINNDEKLEYDLENRLRSEYPRLYALLNFNTIQDCIQQAQQYLPSFSNSFQEKLLHSLVDTRTSAIHSYSMICTISNDTMIDGAKKTAPLWTLIPLLSTIIHFILRWFNRMSKNNQPISAKLASTTLFSAPDQNTAVKDDQTGRDQAASTSVPEGPSNRELTIADLKFFVGNETQAQEKLASYLESWNQIATEPARTNLTKDVNSLCRDSVRSISRKNKHYLPNLERILVLAERVSENKVFHRISQKENLKQYLILYMVMHVLAQARS